LIIGDGFPFVGHPIYHDPCHNATRTVRRRDEFLNLSNISIRRSGSHLDIQFHCLATYDHWGLSRN